MKTGLLPFSLGKEAAVREAAEDTAGRQAVEDMAASEDAVDMAALEDAPAGKRLEKIGPLLPDDLELAKRKPAGS